jgi:hypothetical protein
MRRFISRTIKLGVRSSEFGDLKSVIISRPLRPVHHAVQGFARARRDHWQDIS